MFDCGITIRTQELTNQIIHDQENGIVRAVQKLYVDIDKEKLEKCLYDSKSYYNKGYQEGYQDALCSLLNYINTDYAAYFDRCMTGCDEEDD